MGRRQKRIVESIAIIATPSPGFHPRPRVGERTVRTPNSLCIAQTPSLSDSIRGVVLWVKKKSWFCEPAYDKLRGTEEGIINSRLYNEKAYVLSRGFVRRALEIPLGSLESEIDWLYHKHGRLAKVLCDARALVEKSRPEAPQEPSSVAAAAASTTTTTTTAVAAPAPAASASGAGDRDRDPAVPRLTAGGIITLERTLTKLEALQRSPS